MELGEENTSITIGYYFFFKKRYLQAEVILLAEKVCHTIVGILKPTN
jgi:hypothetical protein